MPIKSGERVVHAQEAAQTRLDFSQHTADDVRRDVNALGRQVIDPVVPGEGLIKHVASPGFDGAIR